MSESMSSFASAAEQKTHILRLYVAGNTLLSSQAIKNIKTICETYLKDQYVLTIVNFFTDQKSVQEDQIIVVPTLIRYSPLPVRRLIGDLSQTQSVLDALGIPLPTPFSSFES